MFVSPNFLIKHAVDCRIRQNRKKNQILFFSFPQSNKNRFTRQLCLTQMLLLLPLLLCYVITKIENCVCCILKHAPVCLWRLMMAHRKAVTRSQTLEILSHYTLATLSTTHAHIYVYVYAESDSQCLNVYYVQKFDSVARPNHRICCSRSFARSRRQYIQQHEKLFRSYSKTVCSYIYIWY